MKVKITTDSTCDLSDELLEKYGIEQIPLKVLLGEESCHDGSMINPEDIYHYVETTGKLPKTNAVNVAEYDEVFKRWVEAGFAVVHFCIGAEFSSGYQNACIAASDYEHVCVVDSRCLSSGQGLLVLRAAELAAEGKSAEEIAEICGSLSAHINGSFVINSIDYLYKGGRCSALSVFGANLLRLKLCIAVKEGKMIPDRKYRGAFDKIIPVYVKDQLEQAGAVDRKRIILTHTRCAESTVQAAKQVIENMQPGFDEILITTAGPTITTHCGPNTLGIMFFQDEPAK